MTPLANIKIIRIVLTLFLIFSNLFAIKIFAATVTSKAVTGNWSTGTNWVGNSAPGTTDDVVIVSGANITVDNDETCTDLIINNGGTLSHQNDDQITVSGNYSNSGTHTGGNSNSNLILDGSSNNFTTDLTNQGTITIGGKINFQGDYSIPTYADLTTDKVVQIDPGYTVTNNGAFSMTSTNAGLTGTGAWVNAANSIFTLADAGGITESYDYTASAIGNTTVFNSSSDQKVKGATYWHLIMDGSGTKSLTGNVDVDGNLGLNDGILDCINFNIIISGDWDNIGGGVFTERAGSVTFDGTGVQQVKRAETFWNFIVNKSAGALSLGGNCTIDGAGTFTQGLVNPISVQFLNFSDGATTNGGDSDSYYTGTVKKTGDDAFVFPVGSSAHWARLGITAPDDAADIFSVRYISLGFADISVNGLANVSENEYWIFTEHVDGGSATNIKITLYWEDANWSKISNFTTDLRVAHYDGSGDWVDAGHNAISGGHPSGSVQSGSLSSFSPFTFGSLSGNNPLPVVLISFEAYVVGTGVMLDWSTESECNSNFFILERSADADNFKSLARVQGSGNSTIEMNYSIVDYDPLDGMNYYRLKQVDYDGRNDFFQIISIQFENTEYPVNVYTNLVDKVNPVLRITNLSEGQLKFSLYNSIGGIVYNNTLEVLDGQQNMSFRLPIGFDAGIYFLMGSGANCSFYQKLLIK